MSRDAFREFVAKEGHRLPPPQGVIAGPLGPPRATPLPRTGPIPAPFPPQGSYISSPPPSQINPNYVPPSPVQAVPFTPPVTILPDIRTASTIVPERIILPELIVDNLLHRGCKLILSGGSKSFKSWVLMDLGLSIAAGVPWWGMATKTGKVLYINFELLDGFFDKRLVEICKAKNIRLPDNFLIWTLRGKCYDLDTITKVLELRIRESGLKVDMIVLDPIYKALGDLDENNATDVNYLMNEIERIGDSIGAATVFGHHFSKGNQASKDAKDRASGSGVFARDPDAVLTMTRHEDENCYVIESELRYLPSMPKFVVNWGFPLMIPDESKDPNDLQQAPGVKKEKNGMSTPSDLTDQMVMASLPTGGLQADSWKKACQQEHGKSGKAFYEAKARLVAQGVVTRRGFKYYPAKLKLEKTQ